MKTTDDVKDDELDSSFDFEKSKQLVINNSEIYKQQSQFVNRPIKIKYNVNGKGKRMSSKKYKYAHYK